MPKLQSPFLREQVEINGRKHYVVSDQIDPAYLWVFEDPEVFVMEKLDGTNVSVMIEGGNLTEIWNRKNLVGKNTVGETGSQWEYTKGFNHVVEAVKNSMDIMPITNGQHFGECIGLGIQDNPMDIKGKRWVPFNTYGVDNMVYENFEIKDFNQISDLMRNLKSKYYNIEHPELTPEYAEGIIFYRPSTGEMSKLRRDMYDWWITDNPGRVNKHVNTYHKKRKEQPEGMAREFSLLGARKKQGLITLEEFNIERDIILKKYGIKND